MTWEELTSAMAAEGYRWLVTIHHAEGVGAVGWPGDGENDRLSLEGYATRELAMSSLLEQCRRRWPKKPAPHPFDAMDDGQKT